MHGDYMNVNEINVLVLAYLGDSVYENYIRKYLINTGIGNVNDLQSESIKYSSAKAQALIVKSLIEYKEKFYIDGFMGIKAIIRYKKVLLSAGYNIWAPKWKFGKDEKADGFYAQLGFDI